MSIHLQAKVADYVRGLETATRATKRLGDAQGGAASAGNNLADSLTATGRAASTSAGELRTATSAVRSLERAERRLYDTRRAAPTMPDLPTPSRAPAGGGRDTARRAVGPPKSFTRDLTAAIPGQVKAALLAGGIAGAAAAGPFVGAAFAGGILTALGTAGIGAGVAASLDDPAVAGQLQQLKASFTTLTDGIGSDFADETRYAISILDTELDRLSPQIRAALAPAADLLKPLAMGFAGFVEEMLPGLKDGIAAAGPVFDVIAEELPYLGMEIGDLFRTMGEHSDEAAAAIQTIFIVTEQTVRSVGTFVDFLADGYVASLKIAQVLATVGDVVVPDWLGGGFLGNLRNDLALVGETATGAGSGVADAFNEVGERITGVSGVTEAYTSRQRVLNGTMQEGIAAAGGLAQALELLNGGKVNAQKAEIAYQEAIDNVSASIKENGRSLDEGTSKGRANQQALLAVADATTRKAQAAYDAAAASGTTADADAAATRVLEQGRTQLVKNYRQLDNNKSRAEAYANSILGIPGEKNTRIRLQTEDARAKAEALRRYLANIPDQDVNIVVRMTGASPSRARANIAKAYANADGGVMTAMADGGITRAGIYPASNPPLVKFAEPETGGEGYIPRNGDRRRNLAIMSEIARWPSVNAAIVPMANGGITAAARGLVSVGGSSASGGNPRLESAQTYLSARDAVASLNTQLKENGRSFTLSTSKGRENRAALFSVVDVASRAAQAKFDETGNVKLANAAYDEHITRLKRTLAQQKVNAATVRGLLQVAGRPSFTTAPADSSANIAFAKSAASAAEGIGALRDTLSLNLPGVGLATAEGRENLLAIIGFLEQAQSAAQDRYTQTGSSKTATALYNTYVAMLKSSLSQAGYKPAVVEQLVRSYGRVTLQSNAAGGVYGPNMQVMDRAMALGPGPTLYGFREPETGGEAFVPRRGDRSRSERVMAVAAGWYGGTYTPAGQVSGGGASYASSTVVNNYGEPYTVAAHQKVQRQADVRARVKRPR